MPIKKGNKLVELRADVIKGLERVYKSRLQATSTYTKFVNELLLDVTKKERFLYEYKPFSHLTYAGGRAGSLFIKDSKQNLIAEIIYKDGLLYCNSPDSDSNCDHVRFATSLIELAKYLHEK